MNYNILTYGIYLLVTFYVTVIVGYSFYKNGIYLITDLFGGNRQAATAINTMLLVGYYLVNLGYLTLSITTLPVLTSLQEVLFTLYQKIGVILLVLGALHVNNIIWLHYLAKKENVIKFLTH